MPPLFHENHYNVLMFDFRAHGRSEGAVLLGALERLDAFSSIDFAASKSSLKIGLLGFSMGGRAAVLAGGESASVDAVVCDCGPAPLHLGGLLIAVVCPDMPGKDTGHFSWYSEPRCAARWTFSSKPVHHASRLQSKPVFLFMQGGRNYKHSHRRNANDGPQCRQPGVTLAGRRRESPRHLRLAFTRVCQEIG